MNPWRKTSQERSTSSNLTDLGWVAARSHDGVVVNSLVGPYVAGREAAVKACGVAAAKLQGYNGAPHLVSGRKRTWEPCRQPRPSFMTKGRRVAR